MYGSAPTRVPPAPCYEVCADTAQRKLERGAPRDSRRRVREQASALGRKTVSPEIGLIGSRNQR
jgi:hypothetical protein